MSVIWYALLWLVCLKWWFVIRCQSLDSVFSECCLSYCLLSSRKSCFHPVIGCPSCCLSLSLPCLHCFGCAFSSVIVVYCWSQGLPCILLVCPPTFSDVAFVCNLSSAVGCRRCHVRSLVCLAAGKPFVCCLIRCQPFGGVFSLYILHCS